MITADFISIDTGVALAHLIEGKLDYAFVFRSFKHHELEESSLYSGSFLIAVKKNHPILKAPKSKRIQLLNELPAITFRTTHGPNYCEYHTSFKKLGIRPNHRYFYDNNDSSLLLLQETNGWAFLPGLIIRDHSSLISSLDLGIPLEAPFTVSLVKNKNTFRSFLYNELQKSLKMKLSGKT